MVNPDSTSDKVPKFITHYSRGEPFRSITSVSGQQRPDIIKSLNESNSWGLARFQDPQYLRQRSEVEKQIRREFIEKGGLPALSLSLTYGDSLLAFNTENRAHSGEKYQLPFCGRVYRLNELGEIYSSELFPKIESLHIEVQLWKMPSREIVTRLER